MSKSIINNECRCFRCWTTRNLEKHHIFSAAYRERAERYGCWVYLCHDHHTGNHGVHTTTEGKQYWNYLKKIAKSHFTTLYSEELFEKEFKGAFIERKPKKL